MDTAQLRTTRSPAQRGVGFVGDELTSLPRLVKLFRDSYAGAQGRQWLQPQILWWQLLVLRDHGVPVNWTVLESDASIRTVSKVGLPAKHVQVAPESQVEGNFRFWWNIMTRLTHLVFQSHHGRAAEAVDLPDTAEVRTTAEEIGLRPWMSSATPEETAGIGISLAEINENQHLDSDEFLLRVLLPGLILVELHWLHAPDGRPGRRKRDLILPRRHAEAVRKVDAGGQLTVLDQMYLRAGDVLAHLQGLPEQELDSLGRRVIQLAAELAVAENFASHGFEDEIFQGDSTRPGSTSSTSDE